MTMLISERMDCRTLSALILCICKCQIQLFYTHMRNDASSNADIKTNTDEIKKEIKHQRRRRRIKCPELISFLLFLFHLLFLIKSTYIKKYVRYLYLSKRRETVPLQIKRKNSGRGGRRRGRREAMVIRQEMLVKREACWETYTIMKVKYKCSFLLQDPILTYFSVSSMGQSLPGGGGKSAERLLPASLSGATYDWGRAAPSISFWTFFS